MGDSVLAEVCWEVCLGQPRVTRHICLVVSSPDSRPERGVATVAQSGFLLCPDVNRLGVKTHYEPPKIIMNTSFIMKVIMTLIVFQCAHVYA